MIAKRISSLLASAMLLTALLSLSSCAFYKDVELLEVVDIDVTNFQPDLIEAKVTLKVDNPNWYAITLTQSDVDVYVNEKAMGKVELVEKVKIKGKSTETKTLHLKGNPDGAGSFLGNLIGLLFSNSANFQAKGYVKGRALLISRKVPVDLTEAIDFEDLNK